MVRQYVGARYVPKFATPVEWAADTSYEALTIVTFNNASYTSKIQVPPTVGNPANNPKYWALTGNYNAQVEQYRQETEKTGEDLAKETQDRISADNTITSNLNAEITNRENLATYVDSIALNKEAYVIAMGDSYLDGWNGTEYAPNRAWQILLNMLHKTSGTNGFHWTQGGMGFLPYHGITVEQYAKQHYAEIPNPEKVQLIIVCVGRNDNRADTAAHLSELDAAIHNAYNELVSHFPNAICFLTFDSAGWIDTENNIGVNFMYNTSGSRWGFVVGQPCGNWLKLSQNYGEISPDGIHPTNEAQYWLAHGIVESMHGNGGCSCTAFPEYIYNGIGSYYVEGRWFNESETGIWNGTKLWVDVNIDGAAGSTNNSNKIGITSVSGIWNKGNSTYVTGYANIVITSTGYKVYPVILNDTKNSNYNGNIEKGAIGSFRVDIPVLAY